MTQKKFNQENSEIAPTQESSKGTQIECLEKNENSLNKTLNRNLLEQWMKPILPFLKPGGKTVALILALGIVSIPLLMMSGSVSVLPSLQWDVRLLLFLNSFISPTTLQTLA